MDRFGKQRKCGVRDQQGQDGDQDDGERDQRDDDEIGRLGGIERDIVFDEFIDDLPDDIVPFAPAFVLHGSPSFRCL